MIEHLYAELENGDKIARDNQGYLFVQGIGRKLVYRSTEPNVSEYEKFEISGPFARSVKTDAFEWKAFRSKGR